MAGYLLVLIILFPVITFGSNVDSTSAGRISIGFTFSPDYSFRRLWIDPSNEDIIDQYIYKYRNDTDIPKLGYTAGIRLNLFLGKNLDLKAGLLIANRGERTKEIKLEPLEPDPNIPESIAYIYHHYYLGVPVTVDYYFVGRRMQFGLTGGLTPSLLVGNNTTSIADGKRHRREFTTAKPVRFDLNLIAGFGLKYSFGKYFFTKLEPVYRHSFYPLYDNPIKEYSYSFGINSGVFYIF